MTGFDKPNYTQVPNLLLDVLMADMTESELKIVLVAVRKIMGYHKDRDSISFSQFEEMSGLSRPAVQDGLNRALEHGWIIKADTGARNIGIYTLAIREAPSLVKNSNQLKNATSSSKKSLPMTGKKSLLTKETENKTKENTPKPPKGAGKTAKTSVEELFRIEYQQYFTLAEALRAPFLKMDVPAKNTPRSALLDYLEAAKQLAPCGATPDEIPALYAYVKERARREEWKTFGVKALVKYYPDFKAQAYQVTPLNSGDWQLTPAPALPDVNHTLEERQRMVESTRKQRIGGV